MQAIQGLGGVGKTQLAVHYAHEYAGIWWIRAQSPITLASGYAALAGELTLTAVGTGNQEDLIEAVRRYLEQTQETEERWLLIFDNAVPTHDARQSLTHYLPNRGRCDVLITSREKDWSDRATEVDIGVLSLEDAKQFLKVRTGDKDDRAAGDLAEALGRLPLALEQAAAYIVAHHGQETLAGYLERFRRKPLARLYEDRAKTGNYDEVVATTWFSSFEAIRGLEPLANDLLQLCAFLASERIPLDTIIEHADQLPVAFAAGVRDPDRAQKIRRWLLHYSLVDSVFAGRFRQVGRDQCPSSRAACGVRLAGSL